jgi:hypothetical protein
MGGALLLNEGPNCKTTTPLCIPIQKLMHW